MVVILRVLFVAAFLFCIPGAFAQQVLRVSQTAATSPPFAAPAASDLPNDPYVLLSQSAAAQPAQSSSSAAEQNASQSPTTPPQATPLPLPPPQPKRILGMMPNYRAVSAGVLPPPPTAKEAFMDATYNAFDYSDFVFVGLTSLIAEGDNAHPVFGKGVPGYWSYYWRGFIDKADGDYWVDFILPTAFHEDERYYARGRGGVLKRAVYAASQVVITPDYNGHKTINGAELLGRGVAQAISVSYYPSQYATVNDVASKYGYALLRDAGMNVFRELWPDFAVHVLHRQP